MGSRTVSNPPVTTQSTNFEAPDLLSRRTPNQIDDNELPPVLDFTETHIRIRIRIRQRIPASVGGYPRGYPRIPAL
ncbi:hypothetical protein PGT21_028862 [Puccinia graminis f. sp. tritici]|uniref:Uncharacterized protein n=1 Tax=Puccinia graminis f. sp. tritici TaxID=56615 RepID=A0A5B0QPA3_PUCGR|nr:hypothetical protein PGT21_028862 [Puccinia graminis f. sp. tritici]